MPDPRAKVNPWPSPNTSVPVGTVLTAKGVAGTPENQRVIHWFKYPAARHIEGANSEAYTPTEPGWYRVEVQVYHGTDSSQGGLPSSSWYDEASGTLQPFTRGYSREPSGHQKVG